MADPTVSLQQLRTGVGPHILLANGFLSQDVSGWNKWRRLVNERYPENPVTRVRWEAQALESLKPLVAFWDTEGDPSKVIDEAARQISTSARQAGRIMKHVGEQARKGTSLQDALRGAPRPDMPAPGIIVEAPAKWVVARQRADATGVAVADAIANTEGQVFSLLGFSLGARVMATAALTLAERGVTDKLEDVHLIGAAINRSEKWEPMVNAVTNGIWNYYSRNDSVLNYLYRTAEAGAVAFGLAGMGLSSTKAHDVDVSALVTGHRRYLPNISLEPSISLEPNASLESNISLEPNFFLER
ncbi:MAG: DUF726 domain-containing protein [Cellulomonadaceae bacterium]|jgi:hypothetical protein|nr:DUF726 domain-containing protein [Cellulomonadaceae bacterium]